MQGPEFFLMRFPILANNYIYILEAHRELICEVLDLLGHFAVTNLSNIYIYIYI